MQKVILDTNVIILALIQKNYPHFIVNHCIEGHLKICISKEIKTEYIEVLNRPKFSKFTDFKKNADLFLSIIDSISENYVPKVKLSEIKDETDNRFLELAQASNTNFIITGNTNDFTMTSFINTKIISPKEYWELYRE